MADVAEEQIGAHKCCRIQLQAPIEVAQTDMLIDSGSPRDEQEWFRLHQATHDLFFQQH